VSSDMSRMYRNEPLCSDSMSCHTGTPHPAALPAPVATHPTGRAQTDSQLLSGAGDMSWSALRETQPCNGLEEYAGGGQLGLTLNGRLQRRGTLRRQAARERSSRSGVPTTERRHAGGVNSRLPPSFPLVDHTARAQAGETMEAASAARGRCRRRGGAISTPLAEYFQR